MTYSNYQEIVVVTLFILVGVTMFTYFLASLSNYFMSVDSRLDILQIKIQTIQRYFDLQKIKPELRQRVIKELEYFSKKQIINDQETFKHFLKIFPTGLSQQVAN